MPRDGRSQKSKHKAAHEGHRVRRRDLRGLACCVRMLCPCAAEYAAVLGEVDSPRQGRHRKSLYERWHAHFLARRVADSSTRQKNMIRKLTSWERRWGPACL